MRIRILVSEDNYWRYLFISALIMGILGCFIHHALIDPNLTNGRKYKQDRGDVAGLTLLIMISILVAIAIIMKEDKK